MIKSFNEENVVRSFEEVSRVSVNTADIAN